MPGYVLCWALYWFCLWNKHYWYSRALCPCITCATLSQTCFQWKVALISLIGNIVEKMWPGLYITKYWYGPHGWLSVICLYCSDAVRVGRGGGDRLVPDDAQMGTNGFWVLMLYHWLTPPWPISWARGKYWREKIRGWPHGLITPVSMIKHMCQMSAKPPWLIPLYTALGKRMECQIPFKSMG